jgi:hypothetical protein
MLLLFALLGSALAAPNPAPLISVASESESETVIYSWTLMNATSLSFPLDHRRQFAFLSLNDSRVNASVEIADFAMTLPMQSGNRTFLSAHPDYSDLVYKACGGSDPCAVTLRLVPPSPTPLVVLGMQGTLLSAGQDHQDHLNVTGTFRMYGLWLNEAMMPALLTMAPVCDALRSARFSMAFPVILFPVFVIICALFCTFLNGTAHELMNRYC